MNLTNYFASLIINCILIAFPLTIYLVYIAYIKSINKKESKHLFSLSIIFSLLLVIVFNKSDNYHAFILLSIPLLLSYISKKDKLSILISIFLIFYYGFSLKINIIIQILEYTIYLMIYHNIKNKKYFYQIFTISFLIIKILSTGIILFFIKKVIDLTLYSILILLPITIIFFLFSISIVYFFTQSKKILDIKVILKQLEKEQKIKASIFKLNHELKNSLAVCKGYLEMIKDADEKKKELYLNIIDEEINRSLIIINDFSNIGKIKQLEKEELDLSLLFEDVKEIFYPLYKEKNGTLTIPKNDELYIYGDYNRLKQVFINIIKNALEAKNKNTIDVAIRIKKVNNNYKISITDNGKGMTKNELNHINEMFFTTKENGSGIGIPFINEIIDLHKGEVNYKSQKNKGTTVTLTLPI